MPVVHPPTCARIARRRVNPSAAAGDLGDVARELNRIAQSFIGADEDGFALDVSLAKPSGLRKFRVGALAVRLPVRLAPGPARLEIPHQQMQESQIPLGSDIAGIDRLDAVIRRASLFEAMDAAQRDGLVVEGIDKIRLESDRPIEPGQGIFLPSEQLQGNADAVAGLDIAGIECMRPLVDGNDLFELAQAQQAGGAYHEGRDVVRTQFQTRLEIAECVR
jgi:hypothetical protein